MIEKKGIIISSTKYKDYDAIINILFNDSFESVLIRGAYRKNNMNLFLTNKMVYADFELYQGKVNGLKLKSAQVIDSFSNLYNDYDHISIMMLINEIVRKCIIDIDTEKVYNLLLKLLKGLNSGKDVNKSICYFLIQLTKIIGVELMLEGCVDCNSKENLHLLSFEHGGLLCDDHRNLDVDSILLSAKEIAVIKELYIDDYSHFDFLSDSTIKELIIGFIYLIEKSFGLDINSKELINIHS